MDRRAKTREGNVGLTRLQQIAEGYRFGVYPLLSSPEVLAPILYIEIRFMGFRVAAKIALSPGISRKKVIQYHRHRPKNTESKFLSPI